MARTCGFSHFRPFIFIFYRHCAINCRVIITSRDGDVAQLVEHGTGTPQTPVRFPGAARDFSPRVNFQCRLSYDVRTPPCAIACFHICAQFKDPIVHARVRWIIETLKHPACTVEWVAQLCRSWLFPGTGNPSFPWKKSHCGTTTVKS